MNETRSISLKKVTWHCKQYVRSNLWKQSDKESQSKVTPTVKHYSLRLHFWLRDTWKQSWVLNHDHHAFMFNNNLPIMWHFFQSCQGFAAERMSHQPQINRSTGFLWRHSYGNDYYAYKDNTSTLHNQFLPNTMSAYQDIRLNVEVCGYSKNACYYAIYYAMSHSNLGQVLFPIKHLKLD